MKKKFAVIFLLLIQVVAYSQTSWIGNVNSNWRTAGNWTSGIPDQNTDAIIGDANFTGSNQPVLNGATAKCKNLILGNGATTSSLSIKKNIIVYGDVLIGASGTINADYSKSITVKGDWTNNGSYSATHSSATVIFSGSSQVLAGNTTFNKLRINSSSILTLSENIIINNQLKLYGELHPTDSYSATGTGDLIVKNGGDLYVYTENFSDNYLFTGSVSLEKNSFVNYASSSITQFISSDYVLVGALLKN